MLMSWLMTFIIPAVTECGTPACQDFESAYYLDFVQNKRPTIAYVSSIAKGIFGDFDK